MSVQFANYMTKIVDKISDLSNEISQYEVQCQNKIKNNEDDIKPHVTGKTKIKPMTKLMSSKEEIIAANENPYLAAVRESISEIF